MMQPYQKHWRKCDKDSLPHTFVHYHHMNVPSREKMSGVLPARSETYSTCKLHPSAEPVNFVAKQGHLSSLVMFCWYIRYIEMYKYNV